MNNYLCLDTDHDNIISEITSFKEFLLRANKYLKLEITTQGNLDRDYTNNSIILVEVRCICTAITILSYNQTNSKII